MTPAASPGSADPLLEQRLAWLDAQPRLPSGYLGLRLPRATALLQGALLHADWRGDEGATLLAASAAAWPVQRVLCRAALDPGDLSLADALPGDTPLMQRLLERVPQPLAAGAVGGGLPLEELEPLAEELGALLVEAFPEADVTAPRAQAWVRLLAPSGRARLLRQPGERIAACLLETFAVPGWRLLEALAVRGDRRGDGLARRLLEAACREADGARVGLRLLVDAERVRLAAFYEALGFREAGRYRLREIARAAPRAAEKALDD